MKTDFIYLGEILTIAMGVNTPQKYLSAAKLLRNVVRYVIDFYTVFFTIFSCSGKQNITFNAPVIYIV